LAWFISRLSEETEQFMKDEIFTVAVVDGQGGGIGKSLVEKLRREFPKGSSVRICALGTNSSATNRMLREGADEGATGENAIVINAAKANVITGPLAIIAANSMLGELTPAMACAITSGEAAKVLIPLDRCNIKIAADGEFNLENSIAKCVEIIKSMISS
jgi:hypothetical protein